MKVQVCANTNALLVANIYQSQDFLHTVSFPHILMLETFSVHVYAHISAKSSSQLTVGDLKAVQDLVWPARSKWFYIGVQLGIDLGTLEAIKKDHHSSEECFTAMLTTWLRMNDPVPSWRALVNALKSKPVGIHMKIESEGIRYIIGQLQYAHSWNA